CWCVRYGTSAPGRINSYFDIW
nr:immunoglobulin heavy chain junction region [Macaca mulatta]MOX38773.1 immunoglobulin heavy chain junction region [Macaca mulatta]MOX38968.1 immunoglobulin heavy chain junction region [Macaca mulatta]MOX39289.1 immunoglobulin heavy chain junction region [Macaca mulatta]MOX40891.1 immunoglobulin heavy chain junction region [Macaca mulatta]